MAASAGMAFKSPSPVAIEGLVREICGSWIGRVVISSGAAGS